MATTKMQSHIQVRIDPKTKKEARQTLSLLGLDLSSAIKLFLRNVVITQSIPFEIRTENGFAVTQERRMLKEVDEVLEGVKKGKKGYSSAKELHKAILAN